MDEDHAASGGDFARTPADRVAERTRSRQPTGENAVVSMPRGLLERMNDEPVGSLSGREMEIVVLAARGLSNHQIATELNLAEATIKRHLANVYQKMGVGSRGEAVRTALTEQWIGLREITHADLDGSSDGSSVGSDGSGDQVGAASPACAYW